VDLAVHYRCWKHYSEVNRATIMDQPFDSPIPPRRYNLRGDHISGI